ncbi:MAG TPA: alpha/beta fold hydrolase [Vicinamibacterales bacterium]|nr:alpha/beta fold hydrolase [Vicinamibacterales bacterium]
MLFASHAGRGPVAAPSAPPGTEVLALPAVDGSTRLAQTVRLAYRDVPAASPGATPILLVHGSPGSAAVFDRLMPFLRGRRVIAPDLPGFGASSHDLPDYSFRAHAVYVSDLLRHLRIQTVHVLGFSMGGGVALHLVDRPPSTVASLTLLSAVGVQEMELLGEYHLNHAVHGAQLGALWLLRTLVPHTGGLDGPWPYARNFYDSDQRPLRAMLRRLDAPVLIVHGRRDPLVPVEAALEHARLIPQSELRLLDENHFMLFDDTAAVGPSIVDFLDRADRHAVRTRATAEAPRIAAAGAPFDPGAVPLLRRVNVAVVGALAVTGGTGLWSLGLALSYRRRRLLLSSWRRLTRWEYWPLWAVYPPVALWIAWLSIKHRGITLFTAANPAIPSSGVVGESKFAILRGLGAPAAWIARSGFIPAALPLRARLQTAEAFMATHGLSLPIVLKPDQGERGAGVKVARRVGELEAYLQRATGDVVIQEYVPGVEFGVFYVRRPSEARGVILSITEKHLPAVIGDGRRTLEQLILDHPRAVCMARFHLAQQHDRLASVPAAGAVMSLGDCGSHCRGAEFLDGRRYSTPALEDAVEAVARRFDGFYFGRFDLRSPSPDAFARGEFTVIELNGVTSEATHIYDPAVSLLDAYRALFGQWSLAFEIGAENVRAGAPVTSPWTLARESVFALRHTAAPSSVSE